MMLERKKAVQVAYVASFLHVNHHRYEAKSTSSGQKRGRKELISTWIV